MRLENRKTRARSARTLVLVATAVAALFAGLVSVATSPATAAAQPTVTLSPSGPFKLGDPVTVSYANFEPNAPIAVGICQRGRFVEGPGDCGRAANQYSKLTTADATGAGSAQLAVAVGALGNATPPHIICGYVTPCVFSVLNIAKLGQRAAATIPYELPTTPTLGISPQGVLKSGTKIDVIATGFSAAAPVAIAQCVANRPMNGPGDCARARRRTATRDRQRQRRRARQAHRPVRTAPQHDAAGQRVPRLQLRDQGAEHRRHGRVGLPAADALDGALQADGEAQGE